MTQGLSDFLEDVVEFPIWDGALAQVAVRDRGGAGG